MLSPTPQDKDSRALYKILLCGNTVLFFAIYRLLIAIGEVTQRTLLSFIVMVAYLVLLLGFSLGYIIYNRFFWRWGITADQLPEDWSATKKQAFLDVTESRRSRSKWLLVIIFPLLITFLLDAIELFLVDGILAYLL